MIVEWEKAERAGCRASWRLKNEEPLLRVWGRAVQKPITEPRLEQSFPKQESSSWLSCAVFLPSGPGWGLS